MTVRRNGLARGDSVLCGVSSCAAPREDARAPVVVDLRGVDQFGVAVYLMTEGEREAERLGTRILILTGAHTTVTRYERSHRATTAIRPSAIARAQ